MTVNHEFSRDGREKLLDPEKMREAVTTVLQAYEMVDDSGVIQAYPIKRCIIKDGKGQEYTAGPRLPDGQMAVLYPGQDEFRIYDTEESDPEGRDIVVRNSVRGISSYSALYNKVSGRGYIQLNPDRAMRVSADSRALSDALGEDARYTYRYSTEQEMPAYHVSSIDDPLEPDFTELRIYAPCGALGASVAEKAISDHVDCSGMKVWVPEGTEKGQRYRMDSPIFFVATYKQLSEVISFLRSAEVEFTSDLLVGQPVENLPGVFIGQPNRKGGAFTSDATDIVEQAIIGACQDLRHEIVPGHTLTDSDLSKLVDTANRLGVKIATQSGRDSEHCSFLAGEPVDQIISTANRM